MKLEDLIGPAIAALFLLGWTLESFMPRELQPRIAYWRATGCVFFVMNAAINIGLPLALPVEWIAQHSLLPGLRLGIGGGFAAGFLAWGFVYYWLHRAEHRFDFLWRLLHQLHHSPRRVDVSGFAYGHPFDIAASGLLSIALLAGVLGLHPDAAALVGLYSASVALVQHLNLRTPGWLEWFMQRPEAHVRHHEYGQHAGNYADWPLWDKLFGTYRAPAPQALRHGFDAVAAARIDAMLLGRDVNRDATPLAHHE